MQGSDFRVLEGIGKFATFSLWILLPLGTWKIIDVIIWLFKNVHITFGK